MQNIMNIKGTCPPHMKPRKLPINTTVETVLILNDLILLTCSIEYPVNIEPRNVFVLLTVSVTPTRREVRAQHNSTHSLLFLACRGFLVFLFVVCPPVNVGI